MSAPQGSNKRKRTSTRRSAATRRRMPKKSDGAILLERVEDALRRYLALPSEHCYVALSLWIAATHGVPAWQFATRCAVVSPMKGCGKTRVMEISEQLCYAPFKTVNATVAALFRKVTADPPTILHDEMDSIFSGRITSSATEEVRGFYNGGFQRGEEVYRVMTNGKVQGFRTFAMAMFCAINDLPDTLMDRSVVIRMRKRLPGEKVYPFRTRRDGPALLALGAELHEWVRSNIEELADADPESPFDDRAADRWESLLMIADLAGGEWPERARLAAKEMAEVEESAAVETPSARLLRDIREVWPDDEPRIHSADLAQRLVNDRSYGWDRYEGRELGPHEIAKLLQPYEVKSTQVKLEGVNRHGYRRHQFEEAWERYLRTE